jgi:myosin heavy subunit
VHQAPNERNFHIFYQLCFGATEEEIELYHINKPEDFNYLNQSKCFKVENIDDEGDFEQLKNAFECLGVYEDVQASIFKVISAVLHLGNIQFTKSSSDSAAVVNTDSKRITIFLLTLALKIIAELINVDTSKLEKALTQRSMEVRGQVTIIPLNVEQAPGTIRYL